MDMLLSEINSRMKEDKKEFVEQCDVAYDNSVIEIAADIRNHAAERPIILLSGPSGSGKTTTAMMIEKILDAWGYEAHTLSMDNYFVPLTMEQQILAAEEKFDLESPERIDHDLLNDQLEKIAAFEPVELPRFEFSTNTRVSSGCILERKENELVILEGIHALNPDVITIPENQTTRIYISVRTRLHLDDGTVLHPEKIRLMRRMLRDKMYRNRKIAETLKMFNSVQRGENRYVMPYKSRSTYDIDTFIPYEIGLYKNMLLADLEQLEPSEKITDVITALHEANPVSAETVPATSLIREFIGDGQFMY